MLLLIELRPGIFRIMYGMTYATRYPSFDKQQAILLGTVTHTETCLMF